MQCLVQDTDILRRSSVQIGVFQGKYVDSSFVTWTAQEFRVSTEVDAVKRDFVKFAATIQILTNNVPI